LTLVDDSTHTHTPRCVCVCDVCGGTVGFPVFFRAGSHPQRVTGLLICFCTYGMYGVFEPCILPKDRTRASKQTVTHPASTRGAEDIEYSDDVLMQMTRAFTGLQPALLAQL
jgi:hypothetical protein